MTTFFPPFVKKRKNRRRTPKTFLAAARRGADHKSAERGPEKKKRGGDHLFASVREKTEKTPRDADRRQKNFGGAARRGGQKKDFADFLKKKHKMAAPSPLRDECARLANHAEKLAIMHRAFYFQRAGPWELFARFSGNAMWNYGISKDFLRLSVQLEKCAAGKGTDAHCEETLGKFERLDRMTAEAMR